jgi:hypothetical protein
MKTFRWSVHDEHGHCVQSGDITIENSDKSISVVKQIEEKENIDLSHYHEFRIKQI